jgi:hypothetical protein
MTGAQLKQLRKDPGEAIGRPLSVNDLAKLCGLPPGSGCGTILEWENGYGPIGPVAKLLSLLAVGSDRYPIDEEIISESDAAFYRATMRAGIIRLGRLNGTRAPAGLKDSHSGTAHHRRSWSHGGRA